MASWMRNLLLAVLLVGLIWSAAVMYWRDSVTLPSTSDMVLVMLGLPLLLLGGLWYGRRLLTPALAGPSAVPAPAPAAPSTPAQAPSLAILATSLRMPHASSAAELLAALEGGKARATLDAELVGDDGYPIMSAHAQDADDDDAREQVAAWIERHGAGQVQADQLYDEHLRGLLLAGAVTQELAALALDECMPAGAATPPLQLALIAPPNWNGELRRIALQYLRQALLDAGWPEPGLSACIAEDIGALLPGGARHAPLTLLVAAASHVGEYTVNEWSADLTLFSPAHQQGMIPGEGAAGVLLSSREDEAHARVSGACALRDSSADSQRRPDARMLTGLAARALQEAGVAAADVAAVVADTGHRTSRVLETMAWMREALPHLDTAMDLQALGTSSGSCADAGVLAALALARTQALALQAPVLCIANEDPFRRSALLVRPPHNASNS